MKLKDFPADNILATGAILGQLFVGLICDRLGRKVALVATTLLIVIGYGQETFLRPLFLRFLLPQSYTWDSRSWSAWEYQRSLLVPDGSPRDYWCRKYRAQYSRVLVGLL